MFGSRRTRRAASPKDRTRRERGAAALEFALIAPLFFFVIFGGIEVGLMFRSNLTVSDLTRNAARIGSIERTSADADRAILGRVYWQSQNLNGDIQRVVIFKADSLSSEVPSNCLSGGSVSDVCNVYITPAGGGSDDIKALSEGTGNLQTGYLPASRTQLTNIGIFVEYEYQYVTGFLDTITLTSTSVEVVELDL